MSFITSPGVVGFSNAINRAVPNNVVPVSYFIASGTNANIDAAIGPKGTGAVLADIPDDTSAGGAKRGAYAVDLQTQRSSAAAICLGGSSVLSGGNNNRVDGTNAVCGGGLTNYIDTNGQYGYIGSGSNNLVDSQFGAVPFGIQGWTRGIQSAWAYSPGARATRGDQQVLRVMVRYVTNNAAPTPLTAVGAGSATAGTTCVLMNNSSGAFTCYVSAHDVTPGTDAAAFKIEGVAKRGANAAATAFVGVPVVTALGADAGAATWTVTMTADTTTGSIYPTVTGQVGKAIAWFGEITLYSTG